ncbi:MAG: helix-turn-helix transcriptional regulator, partial [Acidobacteriaceae bacterium]|nr:helix-turn-helix transcriptional regulator [Acidobacteriaceae bacterium]
MAKTKQTACKRPYELGRRLEQSDRKRAAILAAARKHLESTGMVELTMDALARESGVTRQTVHNLFGTKSGVLEALFDQLALDAGMERMRIVMQQSEPGPMLSGFVEVFT